jgi:hypothetical protein
MMIISEYFDNIPDSIRARPGHAQVLGSILAVQVKSPVGHTLWDTDDLIARNGGKAPETMSSFTSLTQKMGLPAQPLDAPSSLPEVPDDLASIKQWLWSGSGDVPTAEDLQLDLSGNSQGSPFHVRPRTQWRPGTCDDGCRPACPEQWHCHYQHHCNNHRTQCVWLWFRVAKTRL